MAGRPDVVILGAGLSGLVAGFRLQQGGARVLLIEREARPGGLLWTNRHAGVTIDVLPHVFFTKSELATSVFCEMVGPTRSFRHRLGVLWRGGWVDYPFQNHVYQLPAEDRKVVVEGLLQQRLARRPRNLEEFAVRMLGRGIVELFFRPYNEKLWLTPIRDLDWHWHEKKMRMPEPAEMAASILGLEAPRRPVAPHAEFRYPVHGGIESLAEGLVRHIGSEAIQCSTEALSIDWRRGVVKTTRGDVPYGVLISTLPIDVTHKLASVRRGRGARERLRATQVVTVHIVAHRVNAPDYHWFYVPDPALCFYRVTRPDTFNPEAGSGMPVLIVECSAERHAQCDLRTIETRVLAELEGLGILRTGDVLRTWTFAVSPAYPVPNLTRDRDVTTMKSVLRDAGIVSIGRFGSWDLMNMDHCIEAGIAVADEVACSLS